MAYYFMTQSKKGEYTPLDISSSKYFYLKRRYQKKYAFTLLEIDYFTALFNNEEELRNHLIESSILPSYDATKKLSIRNFYNGKYSKVYYDFLYQKDFKYLDRPECLIKDIQSKKYDYLFLKELANHYTNNYQCKTTAAELRLYANSSIKEHTHSKHLDKLDMTGDDILTRLIKLLIYDSKEYYDKESYNYITKYDTTKINYANFHSLIAFLNHYNSKLTNEETSVKEKTGPVKKRVLMPSNQVEQLTLF
ncbi:MAG: hypothetical protein Q4C23_03210 [Mycoplasmatota bacterium]|nr:hypothetical protein [Mycoplasmatota bacterium]